ncbi:tetratricopeptide repeat protein [Bacteriovoracaceae bacterium]|nr:tetratricopeptide repeat protein [Bacteriovoracaceae bacterium]
MVKYRIKLKDNRVIGPFTNNQVGELFINNKLTGEESYQEFPAGDWVDLENHPNLDKLFQRILAGSLTMSDLSEPDDNTRAKIKHAKLARVNKDGERREELQQKKNKVIEIEKKAKLEEFQEFKFDKNTNIKIDYEKLQEKQDKKAKEEEPPGIEKTKIISKNILEDLDKTVVLAKNQIPEKNEDKEDSDSQESVVQEDDEIEEGLSNEEEVEDTSINQDEATQMVNLNDLLPTAKNEAEEVEQEMKVARAEIDNDEIVDKKSKSKKIKKDDKKDKKKMKPIVAFSILVIIFMLLNPSEEETKKSIDPVKYKFRALVTKPVENGVKANKLYEEGMKYYYKSNYKNKIFAAESFKKSLEEKFAENKSLGMLILTYGELFKNAYNKTVAAKQMFNLVKITRSKIYKDINIAIGTALFYANAGKNETAINILENYIRLNKPSVKLFSHYMDIVIDVGDIVKAKKIFEKLEQAPTKKPETYLSYSKYYSLDEKFEEGKKSVIEGLKKYPKSVPLMLEYCKYLLRDQEIKALAQVLKNIESYRAEDNPKYFAKYLEYMGMLSAITGDNKQAVILFKQSLAIFESDSLRSKLASLDIGGSSAVENLIIESKAIDLIQQSQKYAAERNWSDAYKAAIGAVDLYETYIPAKLNLADLQVKRGYFESALQTLNELKSDFTINPKIYLALIKANIEARKFTDAKMEMNAMSTSPKLVESYEFAALWGDFYKLSKNIKMALSWYAKAISRNPLANTEHFKIGKIYFENGYFKKAKHYFQNAITLDPINLKYQTSYSDVLYELEGAVTAISYVRDLLKDRVDNPLLMGKIAIYYHRNGEIKSYERMKQDIEKLSQQDPALYRFLIQVGEIEGDMEKVIFNMEKLLELTPSDVKMWMNLAQAYFNVNKYNDALYATEQITNRLQSYPRAHYFRAKVKIKMAKLDEALKDAQLEIKYNPDIYEGYYVQGEIYRLQNKMPKALKSLEKAITKDPKSVETLIAMGWIKMAQRYFEQARDLYMRAKAREPDNPEIRKSLGIIYQKIGQSQLALEEFEIYLKLNPGASDRRAIESNIRAISR